MTNPFDRTTFGETHPAHIVRGQFSGWRLDRDYDGSIYSLKYIIREVGASSETPPVEILGTFATISGSDYWFFEVTGSTSDTWSFTSDVEARWDLVLTRLSDSETAVLETGFLNVFGTNSDRRTHAELMLSKINSILEGRADSDVSSYSIKSRSISKMNIEELIMWRNYYIDEIRRTGGSVDNMDAPGGKTGRSGLLRVRFI